MGPPAIDDRERQILALWEHGAGRDRLARDEAMLSDHEALPQTLGARNAALLKLRGTLFHRELTLRSRCPACGSACEFQCDSEALADELSAIPAAAEASIEWTGRELQLRAPTISDVRAASQAASVGAATRILLARCMAGDIDVERLDEKAVGDLGASFEKLDPGAVLSFGLSCPECRNAWTAPLDVGAALWSELQRAAEALLLQVDALARTYGWSEHEVLCLSPVRRAAYLQLASS